MSGIHLHKYIRSPSLILISQNTILLLPLRLFKLESRRKIPQRHLARTTARSTSLISSPPHPFQPPLTLAPRTPTPLTTPLTSIPTRLARLAQKHSHKSGWFIGFSPIHNCGKRQLGDWQPDSIIEVSLSRVRCSQSRSRTFVDK